MKLTILAEDPGKVEHIIATVGGHIRRGNLMESLYGFRIASGGQVFDQFLLALDQSYLDFDLDNPKVQALAQKMFGAVPTPEQFSKLIASSTQEDGLKQRLLGMIQKGQPAPAAPSDETDEEPSTAWISKKAPGRITMKRGTVIDADLIARVGGPAYRGCPGRNGRRLKVVRARLGKQFAILTAPYFLVGIGPGQQRTRFGKCKPMHHPDFQDVRMVPGGRINPTGSAYAITAKFKKIMSMNIDNVAQIEWADGTIDDFR